MESNEQMYLPIASLMSVARGDDDIDDTEHDADCPLKELKDDRPDNT